MMKALRLPGQVSVLTLLLCSTALAADAVPTAEQVINSIGTVVETDTARLQFGPRYSALYGWSLEARGGMMLSEALAIGLVVSYGENDRELVLNTGLQIDDNTMIIGTIAGHQQNVMSGDAREWVDQLEGGLSLRNDNGVGFLGGYEVNAYATSSSTAGSLIGATLYGAEANIVLHPIEGMTAKLGAGYERITWADGSDPTEGWTANVNLAQRVTDQLTLKLGLDLRQAQDRYSTAAEFTVAQSDDLTHRLGLEYSYIVDKDGGDDDQRLTAFWRLGFGESTSPAASSAMGYAGDVSLGTGTGYNHDRILTAVMEKPDYVPAHVLSKSPTTPQCTDLTLYSSIFDVSVYYATSEPYILFGLQSATTILPNTISLTSGINADTFAIDGVGTDTEKLYRSYFGGSGERSDRLDAAFDDGSQVTIDLGICLFTVNVSRLVDGSD